MRKCVDCDRVVSGNQMRCPEHSAEQLAARKNEWRARRAKAEHPTVPCDTCHKPMVQRSKIHKTCNICRKEKAEARYKNARGEKPAVFIECAVCHELTVQGAHNQLYCKKCQAKSYKAKEKAYQLAHPTKNKPEYKPGTIINTMFPHKPGSDARINAIMAEIVRRADLPGYNSRNPFPDVTA